MKEITIVTLGIVAIGTIIGGVHLVSKAKDSYEKDEDRKHELDMAKARHDKELEEKKIIASFPDSYWEAKKAEAEEETKRVQIKMDAQIKMAKDKLEAEKEMPEAYFNRDAIVKKAEEEAKASKYAADKDSETRIKEAEIKSEDEKNRQKHEEALAKNERERFADVARQNRWAIESVANAAANALK